MNVGKLLPLFWGMHSNTPYRIYEKGPAPGTIQLIFETTNKELSLNSRERKGEWADRYRPIKIRRVTSVLIFDLKESKNGERYEVNLEVE